MVYPISIPKGENDEWEDVEKTYNDFNFSPFIWPSGLSQLLLMKVLIGNLNTIDEECDGITQNDGAS
jgi:hypothetical protein